MYKYLPCSITLDGLTPPAELSGAIVPATALSELLKARSRPEPPSLVAAAALPPRPLAGFAPPLAALLGLPMLSLTLSSPSNQVVIDISQPHVSGHVSQKLSLIIYNASRSGLFLLDVLVTDVLPLLLKKQSALTSREGRTESEVWNGN